MTFKRRTIIKTYNVIKNEHGRQFTDVGNSLSVLGNN